MIRTVSRQKESRQAFDVSLLSNSPGNHAGRSTPVLEAHHVSTELQRKLHGRGDALATLLTAVQHIVSLHSGHAGTQGSGYELEIFPR